jgi:hypothetical protein
MSFDSFKIDNACSYLASGKYACLDSRQPNISMDGFVDLDQDYPYYEEFSNMPKDEIYKQLREGKVLIREKCYDSNDGLYAIWLVPGKYTRTMLEELSPAYKDDTISSITIPPNTKVHFYDTETASGINNLTNVFHPVPFSRTACVRFTDASGGGNWNNKISSLVITKDNNVVQGQVALSTGVVDNYAYTMWLAPVKQKDGTFKAMKVNESDFKTRVKAYKPKSARILYIPAGLTVTLYDKTNQTGVSQTFVGNTDPKTPTVVNLSTVKIPKTNIVWRRGLKSILIEKKAISQSVS